MENIYWKKTVGTLIGAIWLYTLADIAGSINDAVDAVLNPAGLMDMMQSLMEGGGSSFAPDMSDMLGWLFSLLSLAGYYLFFSSLTRFAQLQSNGQDCEHVYSVRKAYILMLIAVFVSFIPVLGGLAGFILMIVAYAKMLSGYRGLKQSPTFPEEARQGAATLYACTVWVLVGCILGAIPLVGDFIEGIITLVVFFVVLSAWRRIKNAAPELTAEENAAFSRNESSSSAAQKMTGNVLLVMFGIDVLVSLVYFVLNSGLIAVEPYVIYVENGTRSFNQGLLGLFSSLFSQLFMLVLCIYMLSNRRLLLSACSKFGIGILILTCLWTFSSELVFLFMDKVYVVLDLVTELCYVAGMFLLFAGTRGGKVMKLIIPLMLAVNVVYIWLIYPLLKKVMIPQDATWEVVEEVLNSLIVLNSGINLACRVIVFVLVLIFVRNWQKKCIQEARSCPEVEECVPAEDQSCSDSVE